MGKITAVFEQSNWKWFSDDNAEPVGGDALAAENTEPTLPDNTSNIRLRVRIDETAGGGLNNVALTLEYNRSLGWTSFGPSNDFDYADGAATEGNSVTTFLLTGTNDAGEYHESATNLFTWAANTEVEHDVCIVPTGSVSASTSYAFRCLIDGTVVPLASGKSNPAVTTAAAVTDEEIAQARSVSRFVQSRVFGRVN